MKSNNASRGARVSLLLSMVIFGTIGIFRRFIPLSSSILAFSRGLIGAVFLLLVLLIGKKRLSLSAIRKNLLRLCISGALIGFNWILLFEAYRYTTVATATLCYYMAPILVILLSPLFLREKLTGRKLLCVLAALMGMILVSGVLQAGFAGRTELWGVLLGLGAAVLYASVILMNKKITEIPAYDQTIVQLSAEAVVMIPYVLLAENLGEVSLDPKTLIFVLIVGVVHTGLAYALYFGSLGKLEAQTAAIFSYLDPVVAIILSALLLHEPMGPIEIVGAVLVLGATVISELPGKVRTKTV